MKTKTATKGYKDEFGNSIEPVSGSWGYGDIEIKVGPLSKEDEIRWHEKRVSNRGWNYV